MTLKDLKSELSKIPCTIATFARRNRIRQQIRYRMGWADYIIGEGLNDNDGPYLDGYHSKSGGLYFVTKSDFNQVYVRPCQSVYSTETSGKCWVVRVEGDKVIVKVAGIRGYSKCRKISMTSIFKIN